MNAQMGLDVSLYSCFNLNVKYGTVVNSITRLLYPKERPPSTHYTEGRVGQDWTGAGKLAPHWR